MRIVLLAALVMMAAASTQAAPIATFEPGRPDGLEVVSCEDGQWVGRSVDGRDAVALKQNVSPPSYYLYFRITSELREKLRRDAYLVVDFLDEGVGSVGIQYNSSRDPYTQGRGFLMLGSSKWSRTLIRLSQVQFGGSQNGGADFRLSYTGPLTIARIEAYAEKPDLKLISDRERAARSGISAQPPKGMFYTFGNYADESTAPLYKSLGVTSVESYVTWETCERAGEGLWDWSQWDKQVKVLKENGLKWTPFLILGPAYSTPDWFRASHYHHPCKCLEHGTASKIESLWNPDLPKWIDRFIGEFAKRYAESGVIESVLLGIQGDFGEAIYSVSGGGWTFDIPGEYHNHAGFWCDDEYAIADFHRFVKSRYKTVEALNTAWGTSFVTMDNADFPGRKAQLRTFRDLLSSGKPEIRRRWLDFVDWYRDSMTRWSDYWLQTTRKYFPDTPIYLCTGGDAPPEHGSNFAEQCRVAAKNKAGVRITNEGSDYPFNFAITRWVAAAGKHYGAYFGFEPAGPEDETGIVTRIYNATASGASQLHDYSTNVTSSATRVAAQRENLRHLFRAEPVVPVALWYPNVAMTLKWGGYHAKAAKLRDYLDFDYLDESMLSSGALTRYKILVMLQGDVMETADARKIASWVAKGGRLVVMDVPKIESVEGTDEPETILFGKTTGPGSTIRVQDWEGLASALKSAFEELGLEVYDLKSDGIFGTQIGPKRFLYLNPKTKAITETKP